MSPRRTVLGLLVLMLAAAVVSVLPSSSLASAAAEDPAPSGSAVTKSGKGEFADLKVTVSQTRNLINQAIKVSWTGGKPTTPPTGFELNYLQIMQCWGDDPAGPDRTQCQYGGLYSQIPTLGGGTWVGTRQFGTTISDSNETLKLVTESNSARRDKVPFWAVGTDKPTIPDKLNINDYFDSQVTNEIPLARTSGDGTGGQFFEVETVVQAAGLGCGEPVTVGGTIKGRSCWLVVVPRGNTEVDGSTRAAGTAQPRLDSSPLSQSNWDNRIVFPLDFLPVGKPCPIGAPERHVIGHELAVDVVTSWQPALCAGGGALYGYVQLTDDVTRGDVIDGTTPGLALVTNPVPPEAAPTDHPLIYAPIALSGLAIAFNIDHQPSRNAKPDDLKLDGQQFQSMKLSPRLVAKLLTQSYQGALQITQDYLKNNPTSLITDPEFLALNPEYDPKKSFSAFYQPADALVQLNGSDVTSLLWSWLKADPAASDFLAGKPDEHGMVVNPTNKNLVLPTDIFPRNDQSCSPLRDLDPVVAPGVQGHTCTGDTHPFTANMHDAGRSASRGDTQARIIVLGDDHKTPVAKKAERQAAGRRILLAVVDTATAMRYGLPTAALLNSAGQYVAPTDKSLLAGENAMKPSGVPGVLVSDPGTKDPEAYPLTALSYAVTSPSILDDAARRDYAAFLRYAGGPGQQPGIEPGQLPPGLVPLPEELKALTLAAAAAVAAPPPTPTPAPQQPTSVVTGTTATPVPSPSSVASPAASRTNANAAVNAAGAGVAPQRSDTPAITAPNVVQQPVAGVQRTPVPAIAGVGGLFLAILLAGVLAATSSPVMRPLGSRIARWLGRGVRPTEQ